MGRVINLQTAGKERKELLRLIVLALRELNAQQEIDEETKDLAAFIALSLISIHESVDRSVEPWEKRGYWLKADRYRMDWAWSMTYGEKMKAGVLKEDWANVALAAGFIAEKLQDVKLPKRNNYGKPWIGSMKILENK